MALPGDPLLIVACLCITLLAGVVKGLTGFAMPMVMISGLGMVVGPELALAGLILPTLVTNLWQALRPGWRAALAAFLAFRLFFAVGAVALVITAQLVRVLPRETLLLVIGLPILAYALSEIAGRRLRLPSPPSGLVECAVALVAGGIGGLSGVWGPPIVMYLTALDTPKARQMSIQGTLYGMNAVLLTGAHIGSGVLDVTTLPFSAALVPVALAGTWLGFRLQDRIDQRAFRRVTLWVLLLSGANLVRQGLMG